MSKPIAIVGMSCRYPDADSVEQLFENSLAQRRAFRRMPDVRLDPLGYFDDSGKAKDRAYVRQVAVMKNFEFDRERFCVSRSSYDVTDLTHWLALTVAGETIDDIRFRKRAVDNRAVRVVIGNTLTGEFSRANLMRLRWPYVRGVVAKHLRDENPCLEDAERARLLRDLEERYKRPFPVPNEDFLAGGLANTIAGRICNHFDFNGGGYTVDGACSSSLLAVTDACSALVSGDADMVLAGGVDLSLDPFELVGFSRTSALARKEMLVYDEHSEGFWPGEGCGFAALMRYEDALEQCEHIHAIIRGWGVSSDGKGGLTRPEPAGQMLALDRSYQRAGYGIGTVGYFEGHGTGTKVGDAAELGAVITARQRSGEPIHPAIISSIKANIGHTKAAAGLAGLLRATKCLGENILPPTTACRNPHAIFTDNEKNLATSDRLRDWEQDTVTRRAGVSAMGFGGINTHVTLEESQASARTTVAVLGGDQLSRLSAFQDAELFLFAAEDVDELAGMLAHVAGFAAACSRSELTDLAVELARRSEGVETPVWRAAIVAAKPEDLDLKLGLLTGAVAAAKDDCLELKVAEGVFLSGGNVRGKVGLIFSGQGSPARAGGGIHARRFDEVRSTYRKADLNAFDHQGDTDFRQPAIATASLGGLAILRRLGVEAEAAIGHSLGELAALHWAGCYNDSELLTIALARGRAIVDDADTAGAMVAIAADREQALKAIGEQQDVFIANINSPRQTVVSGEREAIEALVAKLRRDGIAATLLSVRQAFHTSAMSGVAGRFGEMLDGIDFRPAERNIISTVTGSPLPAGIDIVSHLGDQLVSPVQFLNAVDLAARDVDLFLEIGPGELMAKLVGSFCDTPVIATDIGGDSLVPFLHAAAATFVIGRAPTIEQLFTDRFARPFDWDWTPKFFQNPCEANPAELEPDIESDAPAEEAGHSTPGAVALEGNTRDQLRQIIADRTGLPGGSLKDDSRMLSDLHLNSITVGEIVAQATASIGLQSPIDPTEYADASIAQIADALDQLAEFGAGTRAVPAVPGGVGTWVRYFEPNRGPAAPLELSGDREPAQGTWDEFGKQAVQGDSVLARLNGGRHGSGVIVWVGGEPGRGDLAPLLESAQRCLERAGETKGPMHFVVIQNGWGAGGFARSFFLENEAISTLVINLPARQCENIADAIAVEIDSEKPGFREIFIDEAGQREEGRLRLVKSSKSESVSRLLDGSDVVLVTGGGKGISAECGFQLARQTACSLLVLGRSKPGDNQELANNLKRMRSANLRVSYQVADVTDAASVATAVAAGIADLGGAVTGIVHGAGLNHPRAVANLSLADFEATISPKVDGLKNLIAAVDPGQLKLLATFSSIIGRIGLRGEADYALANEWLSHETEKFKERYPDCRCRAIEWSVWSGTGMGQRLGRIDALAGQGISPVSIDDGVREFLNLVDVPDLPTSLIVSGRFGNPPTVVLDRPPLKPFRFIESIPVYYPGTELIFEWELSAESDPYLDDHVLNGERLFPAVMALEAMTEGVVALMQKDGEALVPLFSDVKFLKAIVAPADGPGEGVTLRLTALADPDGTISLAIRSSATGFQVNHIEASCRFQGDHSNYAVEAEIQALPTEVIEPFDPNSALYGNVLFQDGRFQRIEAYQLIEARRCCSQLSSGGSTVWFSKGFPQDCFLGDPGARDAALHAIQACIPHKIVIPISVDKIEAGVLDPLKPHRTYAKEIVDRGDELVYDLTIFDLHGRMVETWRGITLRVMGEPPNLCLNSPPLIAPFFERRVAASMPEAALNVSMAPATEKDRNTSSDPHHRPDGKPDQLTDSRFQSSAYNGDWKLSINGAIPVGCDLQSVSERESSEWASLLGAEGIKLSEAIRKITRETFDISATRVWTAREAMKKAGLAAGAPLIVDPDSSAAWVVLSSGETTIYSCLIEAPPAGTAMCVASALSPEVESAVSPEKTEVNQAPVFEYRHVVGFAETNVVGNVYYSNHIAWQGRCREMFLREHCPEVVNELKTGLILATSRCSCEYFHELHAFDEIVIRMRLRGMGGNRVEMAFEYFKRSGDEDDDAEYLAARGIQEIACMQMEGGVSRPTEIPAGLQRALEGFHS